MRPRDLDSEIEINGNSYTVNSSSDTSNIPKMSNFSSLTVKTYCPYCLSRSKLEYSGFLPAKIGYKCGNCSNDIVILDKSDDNVVSTKYLTQKLKYHMRKIESFSCGYNYALSNNDSDKFLKKLKRSVAAKFFVQTIPILYMIPILIPITFIIQGKLPQSLATDQFFYAYISGLIILSIITMIVGIHKVNKYKSIKDSVLDTVNTRWAIKGIENEKENINNRIENQKNKKDHKLDICKNQ